MTYDGGTVKCDGTRTRMYWAGQLGDKEPRSTDLFVMTTTTKELSAFCWRSNGAGKPRWDGMGGS
jgi:hypothetical protein